MRCCNCRPVRCFVMEQAGPCLRWRGGRARLTPVEIGKRAGMATQVLSGLGASTQVVSHPDDMIADGTRVKPR